MTMFEFSAAAARTRIVAARLRQEFLPLLIPFGIQPHDFGRGAILSQQAHHQLHRLIDALKERLVTRTQIVQARLTVRRCTEPIFWAATMTGIAGACVMTRVV